MNIIIVDDEPKIRNGLHKFLDAYYKGKHSFAVFGDALSALDYLSTHAAEVIITDISMPELSGLALIEKIREADQEVSVIILSGYSNFAYAQKAIELGVKRYLTKQTNPREVISILSAVEVEHQQKNGIGRDAMDVKESNLIVSKAMDYISANYARKITLDGIAETLYISPNYLCRLFKRHTEKHLKEYVVEYRMMKAKERLKDLQYKVADVAEMVGYTDTKYFSSTFKKVCGLTPLEYRNTQIVK